jgi:hypothetical protein
MTKHLLIRALLLSVALTDPLPLTAQAPAATRVNATLDDFTWIVGQWTGTGMGGTSEEMWMPPAGGAILGSFRQLQDGKVVFYEILTFAERDGTVVLRLKHFNADLTAWEEKGQVLEFPLLELTPTRAVFNAMTFTHDEKDAFRVNLRLRDRQTGDVKEEIVRYRRVTP